MASSACSDISAAIKDAIDTFSKKYPQFISHVLNGFAFSVYDYSQSTIHDRDELNAILRGMDIQLTNINRVYVQWHPVRKDTIDHVRMYADELDVHRKNTNIAMLSSSVGGVVAGGLGLLAVLTAVPTGGASMALAAVSGVVGTGAGITFLGVDSVTKRRVTEHVTKDEELTRKLARELEFLDQYIGRLGRWLDLTHTNNSGPGLNIDTMKAVATITSGTLKFNSTSAATATRCAETAGTALRRSAAIMIGVGMVLDVALIAYVSYDIHHGSKTATSRAFRHTADKLSDELVQVRKIYQKIENEGERQDLKKEISRKDQLVRTKDDEIARLREQIAMLNLGGSNTQAA